MAVSDKPWSNFNESDYTPEQYRRACLVDTGEGDPDSKDRYKLPVREPSGALNRNGCHAAAARINQVQPQSKRAAAARKLIALYRNELHEDPPDSLTGMGERSMPGLETLYSTVFPDSRCAIEVRSAEGKLSRTVGGYAAVYGVPSRQMQGFREVVERRFFNKSQADGWPGVVARYEHQPGMLLGTIASGTLRVTSDDTGLDYEVDLPESRSDTLESIQRRDITHSSFAFQAYDDEWKYESGIPMRILLSGRLIDVAPTATPAYPDATVSLRSITPALESLSRARNAEFDDVVELAEQGNLKVLFVRTDDVDKRDMNEYRSAPVVTINVTGNGADVRAESESKESEPEPKPEPEVKESEPEPKPEPEAKGSAPEPKPEPEAKESAPESKPEPEKSDPYKSDPRLVRLRLLKQRPEELGGPV